MGMAVGATTSIRRSNVIKAITIKQPFASLIMLGEKEYETRQWTPRGLRGGDWLAIHAGSDKKEYAHTQYDSRFIDALARHGVSWGTLPFGALLGVARYLGATAGYVLHRHISDQEYAFGYYGAGQYGWRLGAILTLPHPVILRGQQGIWQIGDIAIEAALKTLITTGTPAHLAAVAHPSASALR